VTRLAERRDLARLTVHAPLLSGANARLAYPNTHSWTSRRPVGGQTMPSNKPASDSGAGFGRTEWRIKSLA
jgi:hypothetical protein